MGPVVVMALAVASCSSDPGFEWKLLCSKLLDPPLEAIAGEVGEHPTEHQLAFSDWVVGTDPIHFPDERREQLVRLAEWLRAIRASPLDEGPDDDEIRDVVVVLERDRVAGVCADLRSRW